jgi:hypothetical protein
MTNNRLELAHRIDYKPLTEQGLMGRIPRIAPI